MLGISSVLSSEVEIKHSLVHGSGMFAKQRILKGAVVFIKGGHILTREQVYSPTVINSYLPIDDNYFIGATSGVEEQFVKLYVNHSCEPNCGLRGEITFVAMCDITAGEELTCDYACIDNEDYSFECRCGAPTCRTVITGRDWQRPDLQFKYGKYFSTYLQEKFR